LNQALYILKCAFGIALGLLVGIMTLYMSGLVYQSIFELSGSNAKDLVPHTTAQILFTTLSYFLVSFSAVYLAGRISFGSFRVLAAVCVIATIAYTSAPMIQSGFARWIIALLALATIAGAWLAVRVNEKIKSKITSA
jgi:hypothetical protein